MGPVLGIGPCLPAGLRPAFLDCQELEDDICFVGMNDVTIGLHDKQYNIRNHFSTSS
jgi:hypothetical protein